MAAFVGLLCTPSDDSTYASLQILVNVASQAQMHVALHLQ